MNAWRARRYRIAVLALIVLGLGAWLALCGMISAVRITRWSWGRPSRGTEVAWIRPPDATGTSVPWVGKSVV